MNKVEIPLSKTKILLLLLGGITFVTIGTLFIINPEEFVSPVFRNPEIIKITGIAGVLFFGLGSIYAIWKLFDNKVGLSVDEFGIYDNTNSSSIGHIKWSDVTEIKTKQVASTRFLLIYIRNPIDYIGKIKGFKRRLLEANNTMYGTPLSITSNSLKFDFNDLENLINERFSEYCKKMPNR